MAHRIRLHGPWQVMVDGDDTAHRIKVPLSGDKLLGLIPEDLPVPLTLTCQRTFNWPHATNPGQVIVIECLSARPPIRATLNRDPHALVWIESDGEPIGRRFQLAVPLEAHNQLELQFEFPSAQQWKQFSIEQVSLVIDE